MKKKRAPQEKKERAGSLPKPEDKRRDSDDIERAVYDGMQDLRANRKK